MSPASPNYVWPEPWLVWYRHRGVTRHIRGLTETAAAAVIARIKRLPGGGWQFAGMEKWYR